MGKTDIQTLFILFCVFMGTLITGVLISIIKDIHIISIERKRKREELYKVKKS